ncbi:perlucin-like protein [Erpetoichthys calabaricus]|uniref:Perlucin-like protein n=1 Tax=Erpetoichthys calabaricus TaxID=27687 RepID=A0A8C4X5A4_ERPCA|nr:perlucin-like protein [Erpetoichthys calabaricus]
MDETEVGNVYENTCTSFSASKTKTPTNKVSSSSAEEREQMPRRNRQAGYCGLSACSCRWVVFTLAVLVVLVLIAFAMFFIHAENKLQHVKREYDSLSENQSFVNEELNQLRSNFTRLTKEHLALQTTYNALLGKKCSVCPQDWLIHGGSCYYVSNDKKNWSESQDDCAARGGHLVIITNEREQSFLNENVRNSEVWIGLSDLKDEGKWVWVDDTTTAKSYWTDGEPDDWKEKNPNGEDCAHLRPWVDPPNTWHDISCDTRMQRVCEKNYNS